MVYKCPNCNRKVTIDSNTTLWRCDNAECNETCCENCFAEHMDDVHYVYHYLTESESREYAVGDASN